MTRLARVIATLALPLSAFALLMLMGSGLGVAGRPYADSKALWNIVHRLCVPNEERFGDPAPCRRVELRRGDRDGYAVLKDPFHSTQFLLIPTARVTGIESRALAAAHAPNYFAGAWRSRTYVDDAVHRVLPRNDIALAVNSASARTQDQLHIHIDCVRADVRAALHRKEATIPYRWAPLGISLAGHRYLAMKVDAAQLDGVNPFKLLADGVPGAKTHMGDHTLVAIGAVFSDGRPGFIILDGHVDPAIGDNASGEELQDHSCSIAKSS
jgi:CDP-diacylglycerol pyrophosphatase